MLRWVGVDHLGSTIRVADNSFAPVSNGSQRYTPFGVGREAATGLGTDHRFTGQIEDASTAQGGSAVYWYNSRAYDPALGHFCQPDTIVPEPKDPQSLNRYSYVRNNPLNRVDPTGHLDMSKVIAELNEQGLVDKYGRPVDEKVAAFMADLGWWIDSSPTIQEAVEQIGNAHTDRVHDVITREAHRRSVDELVLTGVLRNERAAYDTLFSGARQIEALIGFFRTQTSISPAQMQVRVAEFLEDAGYITERDRQGTIQTIMDDRGAVRYAAAYLQHLTEKLRSSSDSEGTPFSALSVEQQRRVLAISYNAGWEGPDGVKLAILRGSYDRLVRGYHYDDQMFARLRP